MAITKATASSIAPAAKGDLVVGSGTNDAAVLAVGTNNHVLTADSSTTTGLKWAAASSTPTFVGVKAGSSSNPTISNNTSTIIDWNTEEFDTDGFHSTSSNPSRITIPSGKGGYYKVIISGNWQSSATGARAMALRKNGSSILLNMEYFGSAANEISKSFSTIINLVATDYIEVRVYQTSGGNLIFGANGYFFEAQYLGA